MAKSFQGFRKIFDRCFGMNESGPSLMDDAERSRFYEDEIKRLERLEKFYSRQNALGMSARYRKGQGYANAAVRNTIEKYRREKALLDEKIAKNSAKGQENSTPSADSSAEAPQQVAQTPAAPSPSPSSSPSATPSADEGSQRRASGGEGQ